jgi:hypothetical protein
MFGKQPLGSEGFDTLDLKEAKTLLDELARGRIWGRHVSRFSGVLFEKAKLIV